MRFPTIIPIAFCLVANTLASPVAVPEEQACGAEPAANCQLRAKVSATINQWLGDINAVNTFVDTVGSAKNAAAVSSMAATAFKAAQNEGTSNTDLQADVTLDADGQAAAKALLKQFNIIGPAINDTITNPGNVRKNLAAINGARCPPPQGGGAISQEGAVQAAAAKAVGISVPPPATPTACTVAAKATN